MDERIGKISKIGGNRCLVCGVSKRREPKIRLFGLPKNICQRSTWISQLRKIPNFSQLVDVRVCDKHFRKEFFGKKKLKKGAYPSLFMNEIEMNRLEKDSSVYEFHSMVVENDTMSIISETTVASDNASDVSKSFSDEIPYQNVNTSNDFYKPVFPLLSTKSYEVGNNQDNFLLDENEVDFLNLSCSECKEYSSMEPIFCDNCLRRDKTEKIYRKIITEKDNKIELASTQINKLKKKILEIQRKFKKESKKTKLLRKQNKLKLECKINNLKHVSDHTKTLCKMLLRKKKREFTKNERIISQSIRLRSARTYNFLRTTLNLRLPSKSSINNWSPIKYLKPGKNKMLLSNLSSLVNKMDEKSKICTLLFDEIHIKPSLIYNEHEDEIQGFSDSGWGKKTACKTSMRFYGSRASWKSKI